MHFSAFIRHLSACSLIASALALSPECAIDWTSIRCPKDSKTTLPTPTYGDTNAVFTVCTEEFIHAPPESVYDALIDYSSYHMWNSFVVEVDLPAGVKTPEDVYVGMPMNLTTSGIVPFVNTTSEEVVTVLERDFPTWRSNVTVFGALVVAEHPNILVNQGHGITRYVSYETYYENPLIPSLLVARSTLQGLFEQQGRDLKAYVESQV
ncbi:hypothetical protein KVR01_006454 [Diaporthe batatas]|uniref:uncharacterized protein n=1 Tax=Diaporthe batatas TaxID=748121 RepID=UPI001D03B152|nr:uncharacterized protein KVR01_006454 [Diaporthe batatas]KAG8164536.1 hypothetical protein KVR01_006454 [Diaporthe batatas]